MKAAKRKSLTKKLRFEVFKRDKFRCQYCGAEAPGVVLVVDHVAPVAKGGKNDMLNLITACFGCNAGKSDRLLCDDSAVTKQRQALEQLAERREQIEMMLAWKKIEEQGAATEKDAAANLFIELFGEIEESFAKQLRGLLKKHGLQKIADAMYRAADETADAAYAPRLVWCFLQPQIVQDAYRVRGAMRHRWRYVAADALGLIQELLENGWTVDELTTEVRSCTCWSTWAQQMGVD